MGGEGVNCISPRLSVEGLQILLGGPGPVPAGGAERIVVHVPVLRRLYSLGKRGYVKFQSFLYKDHEIMGSRQVLLRILLKSAH